MAGILQVIPRGRIAPAAIKRLDHHLQLDLNVPT